MEGPVRLFFGANTGMELLIVDQYNRDLGLYYDYETFKAFEDSQRPPALRRAAGHGPSARGKLDGSLEPDSQSQDPRVCRGTHDVEHKFYKAMSAAAGSEMAWREVRERLISKGATPSCSTSKLHSQGWN